MVLHNSFLPMIVKKKNATTPPALSMFCVGLFTHLEPIFDLQGTFLTVIEGIPDIITDYYCIPETTIHCSDNRGKKMLHRQT